MEKKDYRGRSGGEVEKREQEGVRRATEPDEELLVDGEESASHGGAVDRHGWVRPGRAKKIIRADDVAQDVATYGLFVLSPSC